MSKKKDNSNPAANVTAFIVADAVGSKNDFKTAGIPLALAPIANRPAIDYVIENLVHNGMRKIVILAVKGAVNEIRAHVNHCWNRGNAASGAAASSSTSGKKNSGSNSKNNDDDSSANGGNGNNNASSGNDRIEVRECAMNNGCFDVITHVKNNNLVRDGEYFMVVPMDTISNISNLPSLIAKAIDRHLNQKLILTAIVRQDDRSLHSIYDAVMKSEMYSLEAELNSDDNANSHLTSINTPHFTKSLWSEDPTQDEDELYITEKSLAPRCTFAFDPSNGMIHAFKEWKKLTEDELEAHRESKGDSGADGSGNAVEAPYAVIPALPIKRGLNQPRICYRTDLMLTGILICSSDIVNVAINTYQNSVADFVNEFLACQIEWNVDIAIDVADSASVVCPLASLQGFLSANHRVAARYLYPMCRESNFGDHVDVKYAVSRRAPLVSIPQYEGCPKVCGTIEGCAVFGLGSSLDVTAFLSNSSVGDHSAIGAKTVVTNTIIGKNVSIGDRCVIANAYIADNAIIPDGHNVRDSVYAITTPSAAAKNSSVFARIVGPTGASSYFNPSNIIPTFEMLTSDKIATANDEDDDHDEEDAWKAVLWDSYLNNPSVEGSLEIGLKDLRISNHKTNVQLVRAMFEVLIIRLGKMAKEKYLADKAAEEDDDEDDGDDEDDDDDEFVPDWDFLKAELIKKLTLWESSVIWHFISLGDEADAQIILEGLSLGMAATPCMHVLGGKILAIFYCLLNDEVFEQREFCVVPPQAIISFLATQEEKEEENDDDEDSDDSDSEDDSDDESDDEDEDKKISRGWKPFMKYANQVRQAFEEDEDEDEDDE